MSLLHPHTLRPADPKALYNDADGRWKCDVCKTIYTGEQQPQHCSICSFDACQTCLTPQIHPSNQYPLYLSDMLTVYPEYSGHWKCDACYQNFRDQQYAYHCPKRNRDICRDCFKGREFPIHAHALKPSLPRVIYGPNGGGWRCDGCKQTGEELAKEFAWHCAECQFDACDNCLKPAEIQSFHNHALQLTDPINIGVQGSWKCDRCYQWRETTNFPFHCFTCVFNGCRQCYNQILQVEGGREITPPSFRRPAPQQPAPSEALSRMPPHHPPVEDDFPTDPEEALENIPEDKRCKVCFEKRAIATFIHDKTGHTCTCMSCAKTIFDSNGPCPICRQPVLQVIRNFTV